MREEIVFPPANSHYQRLFRRNRTRGAEFRRLGAGTIVRDDWKRKTTASFARRNIEPFKHLLFIQDSFALLP
jgi:hypothetical protein